MTEFDKIRDVILELVQGTQMVLWEEDPIGLRKQGAPADEYDSEGQLIVERLIDGDWPIIDVQGVTEHVVYEVVYAVFVNSFGSEMARTVSDEAYNRIAKRICALRPE